MIYLVFAREYLAEVKLDLCYFGINRCVECDGDNHSDQHITLRVKVMSCQEGQVM
jgi:hypothetical protein